MSNLKIDRLQLDIIINGDPTRKEMAQLEDSMKKLRTAMKKVPEGTDEWKRMNADLQKMQTRFDALQEQIGLTGMTMRELSAKSRELKMILDRLDPRTPEWKQYNQQLLAVRGRMAELSGQAKVSSLSFSKMADGFNRYFGMIAAFVASFAGIIFGARKAVDVFFEFEEKVADVSKTTGMTNEEVLKLDKSLQKIDTRTAQNELLDLARIAGKLGISSEKDVEGFVKAADKIKVALAEDLGDNVEDAINQVGKITDIFGLQEKYGIEDAMLKAGSAINSLGASSTANEGYIVEFTKRMAGVAPAAKISAADIMGLGATLDQFGQQSEMSSTAVGAVFTDMFKSPGQYAKIAGMEIKEFNQLLNTNSNEAFIRFLIGLKGNNEGLGEMANKLDSLGIEGKRSISVLGVLSNNTEILRKQQTIANDEFNKGTSLIEEFNKKNETGQAKLEKIRKELALHSREFGEKLAPAMVFSTNVLSKFMRILSAGIDYYRENAKAINWLVVSLGAYITAVKLASAYDAIRNKEGLAYTTIAKLKVFWDNASRVGTLAAAAAQALFTGNLVRAKAAMMLLTKTMNINPFVAIATAVVSIGYALYELSQKADASSRAVQILSDVQSEVAKNVAVERFELEKLLIIAKDKRRTDEERQAAIKELNELSPEYLGNLTLETINTKEATKAIDNYLLSLEKKWRLEVLESKIKEEMQKQIDLENTSLADNVKWYDDLLNNITSFGSVALVTAKNEKDAIDNKNNAIKDQIALIEKLKEQYKEASNEQITTSTQTEPEEDDTNPDEPEEDDTDPCAGNGNSNNNKELVDEYAEYVKKLNRQMLTDKIDQLHFEYLAELEHINLLKATAEQKKEAEEMLKTIYDKKISDENPTMDSITPEDLATKNKMDAEDKLTAKMKAESEKREQATKASTDRQTEAFKASIKQQEEILKKYGELYSQTVGYINEGIAGMVTGQKDSMKEAAKNIINLALDQLKLQAELAATGVTIQSLATPDSIATFGISGVARAAAIITLIEAAFAAVKAKVSQFASGNLHEVIGASDGRTYQAGYEPFSSNKVYSRPTLLGNKLVGEAGPELVLNAPTTRNLQFNYPKLASALRQVYVPQYASGNMNTTAQVNNSDPNMLLLLAEISKKLDNPTRAVVAWKDIKDKDDRYNKIQKQLGNS